MPWPRQEPGHKQAWYWSNTPKYSVFSIRRVKTYLIQWLGDTFYNYGQYLRNCLFMPISVSDFLRYMTDVCFITDISFEWNVQIRVSYKILARINYCLINLDVFNQSTTNVQKLWNCSSVVLLQNTFDMSFAKYWPFCFCTSSSIASWEITSTVVAPMPYKLLCKTHWMFAFH